MISIKLSFLGELRRLSVDENVLSLEYLTTITRQLYHHHHLDESSKILFAWVDEEGDTILLSTEDELKEALRVMRLLKMNTLKFFVVHQPSVSGSNKLRDVEGHTTMSSPSIRVLSNVWPRYKQEDGYRLPGVLGFGRVPIEARTQLVENFLTSLADIASAMDMKTQPSSRAPENRDAQDDGTQAQQQGVQASSERPTEDPSLPQPQPEDKPQPHAQVQSQVQTYVPMPQEMLLERPPVIIVKRVTIPLHGDEVGSDKGKESVCGGQPSEEKDPTSTSASASASVSASAMSHDGSASGAAVPGGQPTGAGAGAGEGVSTTSSTSTSTSASASARAESGISPADIEAWSSELRLLSEMGLHDIGVLLPLLRVHCLHPATLQHSRAIDPRGMQHVVRAALSLIR